MLWGNGARLPLIFAAKSRPSLAIEGTNGLHTPRRHLTPASLLPTCTGARMVGPATSGKDRA